MMSIKVYTFRKVRISNEAAAECFEEIERGRGYYNAMISELNRRVQEEIEYIETATYGLLGDTPTAKEHVAKLIYRAIKRHSRDVRAELPASSTECYTGTYHGVQAAFDAAMSSKRKHTWPGEKFKKRWPGGGGEAVGVHIQGGKTTWRDICSGRTSLFVARDTTQRVGTCSLKVSKGMTLDAKVWWLCRGKNPRRIPDDAVISHALLCLEIDQGNAPVDCNGKPRGKWVLRVTAKLPDSGIVARFSNDPIGISVGWSRDSEGLLVAVMSDGQELRVPEYACKMADDNNRLRGDRDQLANAVKEYLPITNPQWLPKSAIATAGYIERHGLNVREDIDVAHRELFARFLERETQLRRTNVHVRRRFLDIRSEHYRKFVQSLTGKQVFLDKIDIKSIAESRQEKEDTGATARFLAGAHSLVTLLVNSGAELVPFCGDDRERLGDERVPTRENAAKILDSALGGKRIQATTRKQVRKYRRRKKISEVPLDAQTTA